MTAAQERSLPRDLVAQLGHEYGFEHSFKILPGRLLEDRYLVSVHRKALGRDARSRLETVAGRLRFPEESLPGLLEALKGCDVLHLGYEGSDEGAVFKIYIEQAAIARQALDDPEFRGTVPVHLAFKWRPGGSGLPTISHYDWPGCRSHVESVEYIASLFAPGDDPWPARIGLACAALAERGSAETFLLDVRDADSPRRSFDLMLYDANLVLDDVGALLRTLCAEWAVAGLDRQLASDGGRALGHVSGGISREGKPFISVYYGVQGVAAAIPE